MDDEILYRIIKNVRDSINRIGWAVISVPPENDDNFSFAYTVGLTTTFGHPEIIVFGLNSDLSREVLNSVGFLIKAGNRFSDRQKSPRIIQSYKVAFRTPLPRHIDTYLRVAKVWHHPAGFDTLQMIWPDQDSRFPWEPDCDIRTSQAQPLLFENDPDSLKH